MPIGFRIWFGLILTLVFSVWIGAGVIAYGVISDPEGTTAAAGRLFGSFIRHAQEGASK